MALSMCSKRIFLKRNKTFINSVRNGYIVLVPEIGEDLPEKNPLLRNDGLPEINSITIENCVAAIGNQTTQFEAGIRSIEDTIRKLDDKSPDVFDDIFNTLEQLGSPLDTTWGLSKTLYLGHRSLMPTKYYSTIHERAKRARATKFNSVLIYNLCKEHIKNKAERTEEQKRMLRKYLLEGKLNGLDLDSAQRAQLYEVLNKLAQECESFKKKVDTATKQFSHVINDSTAVRDFPSSVLRAMAADQSKPLAGPWKVTLQPHVCVPFLEYCPDRDQRWNVWQAGVQRASGYADKALENSTHLEQVRHLRQKQANLLGYQHFADMSMETKMAGSLHSVRDVMGRLLERALPAQRRELASLAQFAEERGFEGDLQPWDVPYWRRKQLKTLHSFDGEELREYLPLPGVLRGLFQLAERLFGLHIKERGQVDAWHKDVRFFDVFERDSSAPVAGFYFDPYSRPDEKLKTIENSGWMVAIRNHSRMADTRPLAALVFNFRMPAADAPCLLALDEARLLFYKFGHALQHLLSRTTYSEVSGLSNIEWDAVETCGHFLVHWLYEPDTLARVACHHSDGRPLPAHLADSLRSSRQHMSGYELCRELYLSSLDLELHSSPDFWLDVVKRLWPAHLLLPLNKLDSHPCSFVDIVSGEWPAAYYSHIWSRMVAADVFSAFHEAQPDEAHVAEVGKRFRDTFLALGGGCHPAEVFRRFRGRDPSPKALLATLGLKNKAADTDH